MDFDMWAFFLYIPVFEKVRLEIRPTGGVSFFRDVR